MDDLGGLVDRQGQLGLERLGPLGPDPLGAVAPRVQAPDPGPDDLTVAVVRSPLQRARWMLPGRLGELLRKRLVLTGGGHAEIEQRPRRLHAADVDRKRRPRGAAGDLAGLEHGHPGAGLGKPKRHRGSHRTRSQDERVGCSPTNRHAWLP
jgi:hypothetical protein